MASSGKPKRSSARSDALAAHVAARLKGIVRPEERVVLGLSGGVDSIVLLDVLAKLASRLAFDLRAIHVNHQLSPNAASWARFCRAACAMRDVPCRVVKVELPKVASLEGAARDARYGVLLAARADHIALAHNQDDQAETVLLRLLRGAGVRGLAAMPLQRGSRPSLVRPLLEVSRAEIERYARARKLDWIEDESNADTRFTRNWLRRDLIPRIVERVPAYRESLTRAARNAAEAAVLLDDLARIDAGEAFVEGTLRAERLRALGHARAKNVVRFVIDSRGWRMPDARKLDEALRQALAAHAGAKLDVTLGSCALRRHRGAIHLVPLDRGVDGETCVAWRGEREIELPDLDGVLTMAPENGAGLSAARLEAQDVTIRSRAGGERMQPDAKRPRRTVKNLLQESGMPPWERERLPFIYCGEALACIPGVATDWRFRAAAGEASILPTWRAGGLS